MKEEQVHAIPVVADPQPLLACHEGKIVAKFKQELFQPLDERLLQVVTTPSSPTQFSARMR